MSDMIQRNTLNLRAIFFLDNNNNNIVHGNLASQELVETAGL